MGAQKVGYLDRRKRFDAGQPRRITRSTTNDPLGGVIVYTCLASPTQERDTFFLGGASFLLLQSE